MDKLQAIINKDERAIVDWMQSKKLLLGKVVCKSKKCKSEEEEEIVENEENEEERVEERKKKKIMMEISKRSDVVDKWNWRCTI